jgi:hypothetical protein
VTSRGGVTGSVPVGGVTGGIGGCAAPGGGVAPGGVVGGGGAPGVGVTGVWNVGTGDVFGGTG